MSAEMAGAGARTCYVVREDRELADVIPAERRQEAIEQCTAPELQLARGSWDDRDVLRGEGGIGLLVMEGLLIRRVGLEGRFGSEVLGESDLLRPWHTEQSALSLTSGWRVLAPARVALLDEAFLPHISRHPELARCLVARAIQRSRNLAIYMAIVQMARVDTRLHMLFWHLAGRWGRVRSDGTILPVPLTHAVLAELVAARRPTVTTALTDLSKRGLVQSTGGRWLLRGDPPGELLELGPLSPEKPGRAPQTPSPSA